MAAEMTSRERLLAAIRHECPDRVPVSPRIWAFLQEYYGACSWMHHLRAAQEFGLDNMIRVASPVPSILYTPPLTYQYLPPEVRVTQ